MEQAILKTSHEQCSHAARREWRRRENDVFDFDYRQKSRSRGLMQTLLKASGFECQFAPRGELGLTMFESKPADMVLISTELPDRNGFEVCLKLREKSTVPVLMVTTKRNKEEEFRSLKVGADAYLEEPFNSRLVMAHIVAQLRRTYKCVAPINMTSKATIARTLAKPSGKTRQFRRPGRAARRAIIWGRRINFRRSVAKAMSSWFVPIVVPCNAPLLKSVKIPFWAPGLPQAGALSRIKSKENLC